MKASRFFQHEYEARNNPKLQKLLIKRGCEGIGVFWCIVEQLYEAGGKLPVNSLSGIAFSLHVQEDLIREIIADFGLFESDDEFIWSNSVNENLTKKTSLSEKRRAAIRSRWHTIESKTNTIESKTNTIVLTTDTNKKEENKEESNKEENKEVRTKNKRINITIEDKLILIYNRKTKFKETLVPYVPKYGETMMRRFFSYWTETNPSITKMRFELEKTWEVGKRLATWAGREKVEEGKNLQVNGLWNT
jgi:hypothetical protein